MLYQLSYTPVSKVPGAPQRIDNRQPGTQNLEILPCLAMHAMRPAPGAVLLELEPTGGILAILLGRVVAFLALDTS